MPRIDAEKAEDLADRLRVEVGVEQVTQYAGQLEIIRDMAELKAST